MSTREIANKQWRKLYGYLKSHPNTYAGNQKKCRQFLEGVYWILRTGAQWRDLPERYGNWNSVYKRFARWEEKGVWAGMHAHFIQDPDMENVLVDSTVIRAHMCAAGGSKKTVLSVSKPSDAAAGDSAPRFTSSWMDWAIPSS